MKVEPQANFEQITKPPTFDPYQDSKANTPVAAPASRAPLDNLDAVRQEVARQRAAYAPYAQAGPAEQRALDTLAAGPTQHHGSGGWAGMWEHVKDGLKLAGEELANGSGLVQAGEGLIGGIANPQLAHNYGYKLKLQSAVPQAVSEADLRERILQRQRTANQAALVPLQVANLSSQIERRGEQSEQGNRRLDQGDTRNDINAYKTWAQSAAPGTAIPDDYADAVGVPRGSTIWHNTKTGEHYFKTQDGSTYQVQNGVAKPVRVEGTDDPLRQYTPQPAPRLVQTPQGYMQVDSGKGGASPNVQPVPAPGGGTLQPPVRAPRVNRPGTESQVFNDWRGQGKIDADGYVVDPNAKLTPAEEKEVKRTRRLDGDDKANALRDSYMKSKRVPYTRSPLFRNEVNSRMSQTGQPSSATPQPAGMSAEQHEQLYQQNYNRLSPAQRQEFEQKFQQQFGRAPNKPQGVK
jgi:hypothetical protein